MKRLIVLLVLLSASVRLSAANLPPVIEAARSGNRETLKILIQKGANVNEADGDGSTALLWASYRDDSESVDMLLRAGAKVNAVTDLGATALWVASQNGSDAIVRKLLAAGASPNLALLSGETAVMVASRGGFAGVIEQLAAKGANVNAHGTRGQTALMWAASEKHPEAVKVLLAHKADVHAKSDTYTEMMALLPHAFPDYNKLIPHGAETALMFAARVGDLESARLLIAGGSDVNDADAWGVSATTLAAHSNFTEVVQLLLDKGADANAAKSGVSALQNAIMHRNEPMAAALLSHGADPNLTLKTWTPTRRNSQDWNYPPELVGASPLWLAARYLSPGIMKMLIDKGASVTFVHHGDYVPESGMTKDGVFQHKTYVTTVLMAAMGMGGGESWATPDPKQKEALTLEAVKLAVAPGVDVNAVNTDGKSALDAARTSRYESVVKFLQEHGAAAKGKTP